MSCRKCGVRMRPSHRPSDGRAEHRGRGLCAPCHKVENRAGTLHRWSTTIGSRFRALVEDVEFMRDTRCHPEWWAPRLGMSHGMLVGRLRRAGRDDLAYTVENVRKQVMRQRQPVRGAV